MRTPFRALARLALFLVLCAALLPAAPARAQQEDLRYPHLERLFRQQAPPPRPAPPRERRQVEHRPVVRIAPSQRLFKPPVETTVPATFFVAALGDAMALMLADGLKESLAHDRPHVGVLRKGRDSSGLVRDDFFDWVKAARDIAQGPEKVDYVLIMLGANDRQQMRDSDGATLEPFTPRWKEVYAQRVEAMVAPFKAKNVPVVWVGLPIMKSERYGADMASLNEIARAAAQKAGANFVETWERFADESGHFSAIGPDVVGRPTRLRASDGIHFTQAGAVKLAYFVQGDISRLAGAPPTPAPAPAPPSSLEAAPAPQIPLIVQPQTDAPSASAPAQPPAAVDVTALVREAARREDEARQFGDRLPGVPLPEPPAPLFFPQKPAAGPVAPLTGPALTQDGTLAARHTTSDSASLRERALVEGRAVDARPGRADDFSWPKR